MSFEKEQRAGRFLDCFNFHTQPFMTKEINFVSRLTIMRTKSDSQEFAS